MDEKIKVMLVDDHELLILGLKALLEKKENIEVVGEASSGEEAIKLCKELEPEVVVMDIRMPGISGIEACREIKQYNPTIKVLMLTSYADDEAVFASLIAGAEGYVLKEIGNNDLANAINKVSSGQSLLDPAITKNVIDRLKNLESTSDADNLEVLEELTNQEKKVLVLITEGMTNKKIAESLFLGEKTVRNYVSNILRKLGFSSRTEVIAFGLKNKIDRLL